MKSEEMQFVEQLLYMTGREDWFGRTPFLDSQQIEGIRAVWPCLSSWSQQKGDPQPCCDLLNRLLLTLGIKTISIDFFKAVLHGINFSDIEEVRQRVDRFRALCMLEYGSFRHGYREFRRGSLILEKWAAYFPTPVQVEAKERTLRSRPQPLGLTQISADQLFALGYLAGEHAPTVNAARKNLKRLIHKALESGAEDSHEIEQLANRLGLEDVTACLSRAGVPGAEALLYSELPLLQGTNRPYREVLEEVGRSCVAVEDNEIRRARQVGLQNARTYMAMHDLDIYVATSMREPLHFTSNWALVQELFHSGVLADWHLRYFDPTQAFLDDRVQKGLLECLMIKRADLTVYNAQEEDTFGKDAEAGVTLAQKKPVIVFVARLFERLPTLQKIYGIIDDVARADRDILLDALFGAGLIDSRERDNLAMPGKSKADAVGQVIERLAPDALRAAGQNYVAIELIRRGYEAQQSDLVRFAVQKLVRLERRALTFREVHPLSLQTSPTDGVARGVIVTRTVADTAEVVRGICLGTLRYEINEDENNWLLLEATTKSPIRVVTKDALLTTAFWTEDWAEGKSRSAAAGS